MPKKRGRGEGSIRKRADGLWEARVTIGIDPNKKQKRKSIYGKTRDSVQKKMITLLHDLHQGQYVEPSHMTMHQWLDMWLQEYKRYMVKPTTYNNYIARINHHIKPHLGDYKLKDLRVDNIQTMVNEMHRKNLSPETIRGVYNIVHAALEQALTNGLIVKNIANKIALPKAEKKAVQVLNIDQQKLFVEAAKNVYMGGLFILNLATGLRLGELLALTWEDVYFEEGILRVSRSLYIAKDHDDTTAKWQKHIGAPKTESSIRSIPLLPAASDILKDIKAKQQAQKAKASVSYENNGLVFATHQGRPLDPRNMQKIFASILKEANITQSMHIHCLRHTFATRGLEQGIELKVMQELLGHSSIKMTADLYTHVLPDKKIESIMKLKDTIVL